jgi:hypothetical protein
VPTAPNANNVNEYEQKYQYDKMGNVLQVKQLGTNAFTRNFTYNTDVNTLQKVETGGASLIENYTYDLAETNSLPVVQDITNGRLQTDCSFTKTKPAAATQPFMHNMIMMQPETA